MAPVIWGLDLAEIQWWKFKSSYMWNGDYHLRRTKFIVYQCALIFCVVSESLGTAVLSDYVQGQKRIGKLTNHREHVYNNDYVGAGSYNIFAGVFVATIFGAAFFFDLFWPERNETKAVRIAWKICGVLATIFQLASALTLTIITARHSAYLSPGDRDDFWWSQFGKHKQNPLSYKHNPRAIAAVVFAWLGFVAVVGSCVLLFFSINHTEKGLGPKSTHARKRDAEKAQHSDFESEGKHSGESVQRPERAHLGTAQVDGASQEPPAAEHSSPTAGRR